ncbi:M4 family metallopeptidase [Rubrivirga sp. S365]|uniref:M4 family metallopeptidase n=1 Tax=Rubrivirga litoralis TaxID=3075598 RepID=A0ABU3BME6_9BACT|nr:MULTISPECIES: M4 family metallopeptidase [unclassified Rubrivirga]MDT0630459.1 M4 family metallopeptidase [Rubrivirga sp. F394]MDT7857563.1 M4 family metallopeptidase [Rubrivirga sp. S365]
MPLAPFRPTAWWVLAAALAVTVVSPAAAQDADARLSKAAFDASTLTRVAWDGERGTPQFLAGDLGVYDAAPAAAAQAFLSANAAAFGFDEDPDVRLVRAERDDLGLEHVVVQQEVGGVPVWGAQSALHLDRSGRAYAWGGALHPGAESVATRPALSAASALDAARAAVAVTEERASVPADALGEAIDWTPQAELVVYPGDDGYALAYHVRLFAERPVPANWEVFVDAQTGAVLHHFNSIHTTAPPSAGAAGRGGAAARAAAGSPVFVDGSANGTGTTLYAGTTSIPTFLSQGTYYLYDTTRGPDYIRTLSANGQNTLPGSYVTDADNNFSASNQRIAVSAHTGAVQVFDYFKGTHGRSSYDGNNASITSTVSYDDVPGGDGYNNAFWNGQQMVYGDGDGRTFSPLVELDIVAHELTHAVTGASAGLIYQNESGALNEAVSDIFAVMVDRDDYRVGEESYTPGTSGDALRYLDDPPAGDQPDHYADRYVGSQDNGGVHINSGIANKQAYLMMAGGTFRGQSVQSVGRGVTEKVWYRALTRYFTASTNFAGAREGTLQAAADLYGAGSSQARAVADAWAAVGVGSASGGSDGGTGGGTPEWRYETQTIQSPHPYSNSLNNTKSYSKSGAQRVAMYFERFELEANYDYVYVKDQSGTTRATYTGTKDAFWAIVDGPVISANLVTDRSVTGYGYRVTRVAYFSDRALLAADAEGTPLAEAPTAPPSDPVLALQKAEVVELSLALAPNPARSAATVTVGLPEGGAVRVAVYDLLGREVAVAADGTFEAGLHPVALQTAALPAGAYVVVLDAAGERRTSRLTVVR